MDALRHSLVPPSGVASRARGTQTVTAPNVPIRVRSRWPWRWPDTGERAASALGSVSGALPRSTLAAKRSLQLGFEQFLDEGADAGAHPRLQRIKPVLAEKKRRLSRLRGRGCDICRHGVISAGAPTPVMAWGTSRRLRRPHIPTTAPTAPREVLIHTDDELRQQLLWQLEQWCVVGDNSWRGRV